MAKSTKKAKSVKKAKSTKKAKTIKRKFNEDVRGYPLTENEFLKWKLLESEANLVKADMDKIMMELQLLKLKNPEILKLEDKFLRNKQEFTKKKNEYMVYVKEICQEFGLDETKVCIDDEFGVLKVFE